MPHPAPPVESLGYIRSVCGDIPAAALGVCQMHEHLLATPPEPYASRDPDLVLDSIAAASREMIFFQAAGGRAIVEMTPIDHQRKPQGLHQISAATGVHIIAVTGFLKEASAAPWLQGADENHLAARLRDDILQGMDGTGIRAGVIKAASSLDEITPLERKAFRAAAQAHHATGALISTHSERGTMALEQVELLLGAGVAPDRILIGHLDHRLDWGLHRALAESGVYLGYDQIGKEKYAPDQRRIDFIQRMVAEGFAQQLMLSCDLARKSYMPSYGGGPGFTYLLWRFVPWLREAGLPAALIHTLLVENPARALALRPSPPK